MSRYLKKDNKALAGLKVKFSNDIWDVDKKGNYRLKKNINLFGRVDVKTPNMILKQDKNNKNKFIDDFSALPRKTKENVANELMNNKRRVVYLVSEEKKKRNKR